MLANSWSSRPILAVAIAAMAAPALAAGPLDISTRMLVEQRVAAADGTTTTRLVAPAKVVPGDRVTVVLAYRNTGRTPIADLVLANPVPAGIAYRGPATGSPVPDVSVDGRTFGSLATRRVAVAGESRAATLDDVTHVRWRLATPLAAGSMGERAFQAVLK